MRTGLYLSSLTKPELEKLEEQLNLTDDEAPVFFGLSKGRSKTKIAGDNLISISTVDKRTRSIAKKLNRILEEV